MLYASSLSVDLHLTTMCIKLVLVLASCHLLLLKLIINGVLADYNAAMSPMMRVDPFLDSFR